jgi:hypothetical protein
MLFLVYSILVAYLVSISVCSVEVRPLALYHHPIFLLALQEATFPRGFPTKMKFMFYVFVCKLLTETCMF